MKGSTWRVAAVLAISALAGPAVAQDSAGIIEEVRVGGALSDLGLRPLFASVYVLPDLTTFDIAKLDSLQVDVMFRAFDLGTPDWLGSFRPAIGGIVNLAGRESVLHAALNWHLPLGDIFYLEAEGGLALHNGALSGAAPPLKNLGCPVLFHWSYGAGANLGGNWTVTANFQHVSNVIFGCTPNDGLNHFGITIGHRF